MYIKTRFEVRWYIPGNWGGRSMKQTFAHADAARDFQAKKVEKTGMPHTDIRIVKITEEEI
jgi:hypothetical protein